MKKYRLKIFQRIIEAQAATPDPAGTDSGQPTSTQSTVNGSPNPITTDQFPGFDVAWGANYKDLANQLLDTLNQGIYILTIGEQDFSRLRSSNFTSDSTKFDAFADSVIAFSGLVYKMIFGQGKPLTEAVPNKKEIISYLISNFNSNVSIPNNLNNKFPESFLQSKIGNFKTKVNGILNSLNSL